MRKAILIFATLLQATCANAAPEEARADIGRFVILEAGPVCVSWIQSPRFGQHNPTVLIRTSCDMELSKYSGAPIYSPSKERHLSRETSWALDCSDQSAVRAGVKFFAGQFWEGTSSTEGLDATRIRFPFFGERIKATFNYACGIGPKVWPPWVVRSPSN